MQVDPIKTKLKLPGTKRLKLTCDVLPPNFAFKFNLRRYTAAAVRELLPRVEQARRSVARAAAAAAGAYTRPLFRSI